MKHTPGNWIHLDGSIYSESDPSGKDIATINKNGNTTEEEEQANGDLIAAAPDLLEALKDVLSQVNDPDSDFNIDYFLQQRIEAAIQKATS